MPHHRTALPAVPHYALCGSPQGKKKTRQNKQRRHEHSGQAGNVFIHFEAIWRWNSSRSYISEGSSIMPSFPFSGPDIKLEVGVEYEKGTIT